MSINAKNWIRVVVIVGVLAWPGVESYRLWDTTQRMAEAQALERNVHIKLEACRARNTEVAHANSPGPTSTQDSTK